MDKREESSRKKQGGERAVKGHDPLFALKRSRESAESTRQGRGGWRREEYHGTDARDCQAPGTKGSQTTMFAVSYVRD